MLVFWIYLFIYSLLTISRDIVFGPPGRSKAAILFYFCNLFLWGYPVYFCWVSIFNFFIFLQPWRRIFTVPKSNKYEYITVISDIITIIKMRFICKKSLLQNWIEERVKEKLPGWSMHLGVKNLYTASSLFSLHVLGMRERMNAIMRMWCSFSDNMKLHIS